MEYIKNMDPFDIPLDRYKSLIHDGKYRSLANRIITEQLYKLYGTWIDDEFGKRVKAKSLVLCDRKVIIESEEIYGPKNLAEIEEGMGKPCYLVGREPLIEESGWSNLGEGDYYPTIYIYVGRIDWSDDDVFEKGFKVRSDFDTGIAEEPERIWRSRHLGRVYFSYLRSMKVGIKDERQGRCLEKVVEGIDFWDSIEWNPYKLANLHREGFVGRDIMLKLLVKVTLDPKFKESRWEVL